MIYYSINEPKRVAVWLGLAVVASSLVIVIQKYLTKIDLQEWWTPSVLMVFVLLLTIVELLFSRARWISKLLGIPNYNGEYDCVLTRIDELGSPVESKATCYIQQGFLKISIQFEGRGCSSHATCAGITIRADKVAELQWCYMAHDTTAHPNPNKYHPGTTQVQVNLGQNNELRGRYFTSQGRRGSIQLQGMTK